MGGRRRAGQRKEVSEAEAEHAKTMREDAGRWRQDGQEEAKGTPQNEIATQSSDEERRGKAKDKVYSRAKRRRPWAWATNFGFR
eukprot:1830066-Rhodomonas_salina.1